LLNSDVGCVIFPNSGDSSATPTSSSIVAVHLWPKLSTPSRSPRRFLSILSFPCAFGCHSHLIPVFFFPCVPFRSTSMRGSSRALCSPVRVAHAWPLKRAPACQETEPHVATVVFPPPTEIRPPPPVPTASKHTCGIPSTSSFRSEPRPNL
jgi:hypothetical protein